MEILLWIAGIFAASVVLTGYLRHYALRANLLDIPNARSSHDAPTPRGGGVAIVISFLLGVLGLFGSQRIAPELFQALLGAGIAVAIIGFVDDYQHVKARWRLAVHFGAAGWVLYCLQGLPDLHVFGLNISASWLLQLAAVFYLVWLLNLYNFMDGIDGLAGIEAITTCLGASVLYLWQAQPTLHIYPLALLAAAVAGFLWWNFPPAKIFMGDAGSGFLGIALGILSIQAARLDSNYLWSWLILLGVFIVDASVTLIRRFLRGQKLHEAHRSHAYQYASRQFGAHKPVSVAVLIINLGWLLPWALAAGTGRVHGPFAMLLAYLPLLGLAFKFKAGEMTQE